MNNKEILDNAPDWADTHRKLLDYPDCTTYANNADDEQVLDRSLVDIKELVELRKANAELEKKLSYAETMSDKEQVIRDLEQQAKGILEAVEYLGWEVIYTDTCPKQSIGKEFRFVAGQFTKEAEALKETK